MADPKSKSKGKSKEETRLLEPVAIDIITRTDKGWSDCFIAAPFSNIARGI